MRRYSVFGKSPLLYHVWLKVIAQAGFWQPCGPFGYSVQHCLVRLRLLVWILSVFVKTTRQNNPALLPHETLIFTAAVKNQIFSSFGKIPAVSLGLHSKYSHLEAPLPVPTDAPKPGNDWRTSLSTPSKLSIVNGSLNGLAASQCKT